jgi:hypothetical protein
MHRLHGVDLLCQQEGGSHWIPKQQVFIMRSYTYLLHIPYL